MTPFVDTHTHLGDAQFDDDRQAVIARSLEAGVTRLIEIADAPEEWNRAAALVRTSPNSLRCAFGLHPYYADRFDGGLTALLQAALAATPEAVAIGEIGLDYAKTRIPPEVQRRAFAALLEAGRDWGVPLIIHCRDAYADLVDMLRERFRAPPTDRRFWGVVHCFSGTSEDAEACAALGFALGADGPTTYKKNEALREAFLRAGPGVTVLETDCPYLPPQSSRGQRNEPKSVVEIAAKLAEIWSLPIEDVARLTSRNASDLFRWPA